MPPFRGCDVTVEDERVQFYSDIGVQGPHCFYSSMHDGGLEHIAKFHPNATILLLHRKFDDWYESILKWGGGRLLQIWRNVCGFGGPPHNNSDDTQEEYPCLKTDVTCWRNFYNAHTEKIRRFAVDNPTLTYLEVQLDDATPSALESYTGIPSNCFQHCHPGRPKDPNVDLKTYKKCKPIITRQNDDERRTQYGDDGGVDAPTLSVRNATMMYGEEEEKVEEPKEEEEEEEEWKPLPWSLPSHIQESAPQQSSVDFMNELDELKRSLNISLPWDDRSSLPTPIISLNLPKTGTTTLTEYFDCGGLVGAHTFVKGSIRIGDCMLDNYVSDEPPFRGCESNAKGQRIQFYADVGVPEPHCFYSSLHDGGLEHIAKFHPHATIVVLHRKFEDWYESILKWGRGRILGRWTKVCRFAGSHSDDMQCLNKDVTCWRSFYNAHTEKIRRFAIDNPSLTYLELELDETTSSVLESYTGIPSNCFQHCHPKRPKDPAYKKCNPITTA
jgi:hypothetical protein